LVEQQSYDAYGNSAGSTRTRYGLTGRERDSLTGLLSTARDSTIRNLGASSVRIRLAWPAELTLSPTSETIRFCTAILVGYFRRTLRRLQVSSLEHSELTFRSYWKVVRTALTLLMHC